MKIVTKIVTFWRMSRQQKTLFFINFFLCGVARILTKLIPYRKISPYFGKNCHITIASTIISKEQMAHAKLIGRSIRLVARYTPWNSNCLSQAMVARFWCHYLNIPYMFFIGFAKKSDKPLGEDAHAWVTAGPIAITGGYSFSTHQVVLSYSGVRIMQPTSN